jgi:hypothetical protein
MRSARLHDHRRDLKMANGDRCIYLCRSPQVLCESRVKAWVCHWFFEGETIMRALLVAALAVLTLSIATAAFAKGGGGDGGQDARVARSGQYYAL